MNNKSEIFQLDDPKKWNFVNQFEGHVLTYCHTDDNHIYKYVNKLSGEITCFDFEQVLLYDTVKHKFIDQLDYILHSPIKFIVNLLYKTCTISENGTYKRDTTFIVGIKKMRPMCYKVKWVSVYHNDYCKIYKDRSIKCYVNQTSYDTISFYASKREALKNSGKSESVLVDAINDNDITKRTISFDRLNAKYITVGTISSDRITTDKLTVNGLSCNIINKLE